MKRDSKKSDPRVNGPDAGTPALSADAPSAEGAATAGAPPPAAEPVAPAAAQPPDELTALRKEVAELRDKHLRSLAEAQNLHKRAQREKQEAIRFAEGELVRELLVVLDDLERTLASAKSGADAAALTEGVRIVYEHFVKVLAAHGVAALEATGKPFDPAFHEALMQQPHDTVPAGAVIQEATRGYRMHERVLRPSRVIVSAGPAAGALQPEPPPVSDDAKE